MTRHDADRSRTLAETAPRLSRSAESSAVAAFVQNCWFWLQLLLLRRTMRVLTAVALLIGAFHATNSVKLQQSRQQLRSSKTWRVASNPSNFTVINHHHGTNTLSAPSTESNEASTALHAEKYSVFKLVKAAICFAFCLKILIPFQFKSQL